MLNRGKGTKVNAWVASAEISGMSEVDARMVIRTWDNKVFIIRKSLFLEGLV